MLRTNLAEKTEQEIITLVLAGQKEQYKELVKRHQDKIYRYVTYLISNAELAKDATQAAFIKAYINLNGYDQQQKFSSWLYRIAHNEAISLVRKEKNLVGADLSNLPERADGDLGHLEKLIASEEKAELFRVLQRLPRGQKQALLLYYMEEKSYEEIAEIMRTNKNNVGSEISRAKKKIAKLIGRERR